MTWHGIPIPYADRDDWLIKRRAGIGASDVAGILGLSPYSTPFTVWADKTQGAEKEVTEAMHFGKKLEPVILEEFTERTGLYVGGRELLVRHPEIEWLMATVDGLAFESPTRWEEFQPGADEPLGNVQVKTGFSKWDEVPVQYQIQVQWEMLATGLDQTWIPAVFGGRRFEVYEVEADSAAQEKILARVTEFRDRFILGGETPEVDAHDATTRVIADLWSDPSGDAIELSPAMAADVAAWKAMKAEEKRVGDEVTRLANRVKVAMQDATEGLVGGLPVVTYRQRTVKEHVRKESTFRVLLPVDEKEES